MTTKYLRVLLAAAAILAALIVAACGDDDNSNENSAGNGVDVAFIDGMTPHHESAIDMAKIAQKRAESDFVKDLANDIVEAQDAEIQVMGAIRDGMHNLEPEDLGLGSHEMGMEGDMAMLETAKPFDREFIDMMIPHHQGAIRMAHVQLSKGKSDALKKIAEDVIAAQSREIKAMNEFRKTEYGAESPAGGVPEDDTGGEHTSGH